MLARLRLHQREVKYLKDDETIAKIGVEIVHMWVEAETVDEVSIGLLLSRFFDHQADVGYFLRGQIQVRKRVEQIGDKTDVNKERQCPLFSPSWASTITYAKLSLGLPLTTSSGAICARALILSASCNMSSARRRRSFSYRMEESILTRG